MSLFAGGQSATKWRSRQDEHSGTEDRNQTKAVETVKRVNTKNRRGEKLENHRKTSQAIGGEN